MNDTFSVLTHEEKLARTAGKDFSSLSTEEKMFVMREAGIRTRAEMVLYTELARIRSEEIRLSIEEGNNRQIPLPSKPPALLLKLHEFRGYRNRIFKAFDSYKASVAYFGIVETEEERQEIETWYQAMKDFTEVVTEDTTVSDYPTTPERIKYYL